MEEFLPNEAYLYRNIDEDPIPLPTHRYNLSNDSYEWPLFKNLEDRETYIRQFLLHQYSLRQHPTMPAEANYRAVPKRETCDNDRVCDELRVHFLDPRTPGVVQDLHLVDKECSLGPDRGNEALSNASSFPVAVESRVQDRVRIDEGYDSETAPNLQSTVDTSSASTGRVYRSAPTGPTEPETSDGGDDEGRTSNHHHGNEIEAPLSTRPVGSLRGMRYAALKARARARARSSDEEDDEERDSENQSGDGVASHDSVRAVGTCSDQPTYASGESGHPNQIRKGSQNDTMSVPAVFSAPQSFPDSKASSRHSDTGETVLELNRTPSRMGESGLNEMPLPEADDENFTHLASDVSADFAQPAPYSHPQGAESDGEGCEACMLVTCQPEQAVEPPPSPNQGSRRLIETRGTESTLVRARIVANEFDATETSGLEVGGTTSLRSAYPEGSGPAESVKLDESIVTFAGEENYWFKPARGDILITNPGTIVRDLGTTYAPWLRYTVETCPDAPPALTESCETERPLQQMTGCLKVWNGLYMNELDEFLQHGDLVLRMGTWRSQEENPDRDEDMPRGREEHPYSPYYRVDLHSVRRLRPVNKYIFLGYQHPLHLEGRVPSCMLDSPGKYLNAGAPCPSSFAPAIGDIIIKKDAFSRKFTHKENFRRSMVKWYKTRTSISQLHGPVEQSTDITAGTLLLRPYLDKIQSDSVGCDMDHTTWGGAELYRYENRGWVFWGRDQLLVEFGSIMFKDIPVFYVADPGREEDNPNYPSSLILAHS